MRPRYLVLAGQIDKDRLEAIVVSLQPALPERREQKEAVLLTGAGCPVIDMPAVDGWIVGTLFSADGRDRCTSLDRGRQLAIMSAPAQVLIAQASGSYVAVWRGEGAALLNALRDPSACLPAWTITDGPLTAIASDVDLLASAGLIVPKPDAIGLIQHLRYPYVPNVRTGLSGVSELLPGHCTRFAPTFTSRALWHPRTFADRGRLETSAIADAVDTVVAGQRRSNNAVGIEFSGGLDSSIVAAALDRSGGCGIGLHMVPSAGDADERPFARLVAERFPMAVREIPIGRGHFDLLARPARLTARPTGFSHMQGINRAMRQAQLDAGIDTLFSGAGGDSVFCSLHSTGPVIDAWKDGGWRLAEETASAVAEIVGTTRGTVLRHAIGRVIRDTRRRWRWPADDRLLTPRGSGEPEPDTALLEGLRPGARAHVAGLLRIQSIMDAHDRMGESGMFFPLLAQPVIESCLSVPSWRWMSGGRDRSAARDAFAGRVPEAILRRRGKAHLDTLLVQAYEQFRAALRTLLTEGWLAKHDIIDREAVARALSLPVSPTSTWHSRIFALADAESWCQMVLAGQGKARPC